MPEKKGCTAIEMECATLFGLGKLRKVKTAPLLVVSDDVTESAPIIDSRGPRDIPQQRERLSLRV
ncbi:MAG TPA: hypothetical protein VLY82_07710 [Nitrososphaerales archaeon]|nr:hypothetical protein [Nitrososphaerales archaeon]